MPYREKRRELAIAALLVAFNLVLISIQVPKGGKKTLFEQAVFAVYSPVQKLAAAVVAGVSDAWEGFFGLRAARRENFELKKELFFRAQENRFLEERLRYFQAESALKANLKDFKDRLITARVVGSDPSNIYQTVVIDKGSDHGVRKHMNVCDKFGNLVGKVIDPVGRQEAMVQLITDKDSNVSVISEENRLVGLFAGRSAYLGELKFVLATSPKGTEGEQLLTTGFDGIFQPGLRVGRILKVSPDVDAPIFQKIIVQPNFRFNELDAVAVLPSVSSGGVR
jgi:rod shape-determining protein MreC